MPKMVLFMVVMWCVTPVVSALAQQPQQLLAGELVRDTGEAFDITQPAGKIRVINFWATWCPPCIKEMPTLVALAETYADQPLEVVLINEDQGGHDKGRIFLVENGWDQGLIRLYDHFGRWMRTMKVRAMPTTLIVDGQNRVLEVVAGDRDWMAEDIRQRLDGWLKSLS